MSCWILALEALERSRCGDTEADVDESKREGDRRQKAETGGEIRTNSPPRCVTVIERRCDGR